MIMDTEIYKVAALTKAMIVPAVELSIHLNDGVLFCLNGDKYQ